MLRRKFEKWILIKCKMFRRKCLLDKLNIKIISKEIDILDINDSDEINFMKLKSMNDNKIKIQNSLDNIKNMEYKKQIDILQNAINKIDILQNIKTEENNNILYIFYNYIFNIKYKQNKHYIVTVKKYQILINQLNTRIFQHNNKITEYKFKINNNNFIINNYKKNIQFKIKYQNQIKIYDTLAKSVCIHGIPSLY